MRSKFIAFLIFTSLALKAQNQIDFRAMPSLNADVKLTRRLSITGLADGIFYNDYRELGFAFFDTGIKYKITRNFGVNGNYRYLLRRNLDNFYDQRHLLYFDLDVSKGYKRWSFGGTTRFQCEFFSRFIDSYHYPLAYNRSKVNAKYRINYYWQPFAEFEMFTPLNHPIRKTVDQVRFLLGFNYTFTEKVKVEVFFQVRQQINRAPKNTIYLTAMNWYFRF